MTARANNTLAKYRINAKPPVRVEGVSAMGTALLEHPAQVGMIWQHEGSDLVPDCLCCAILLA